MSLIRLCFNCCSCRWRCCRSAAGLVVPNPTFPSSHPPPCALMSNTNVRRTGVGGMVVTTTRAVPGRSFLPSVTNWAASLGARQRTPHPHRLVDSLPAANASSPRTAISETSRHAFEPNHDRTQPTYPPPFTDSSLTPGPRPPPSPTQPPPHPVCSAE